MYTEQTVSATSKQTTEGGYKGVLIAPPPPSHCTHCCYGRDAGMVEIGEYCLGGRSCNKVLPL